MRGVAVRRTQTTPLSQLTMKSMEVDDLSSGAPDPHAEANTTRQPGGKGDDASGAGTGNTDMSAFSDSLSNAVEATAHSISESAQSLSQTAHSTAQSISSSFHSPAGQAQQQQPTPPKQDPRVQDPRAQSPPDHVHRLSPPSSLPRRLTPGLSSFPLPHSVGRWGGGSRAAARIYLSVLPPPPALGMVG